MSAWGFSDDEDDRQRENSVTGYRYFCMRAGRASAPHRTHASIAAGRRDGQSHDCTLIHRLQLMLWGLGRTRLSSGLATRRLQEDVLGFSPDS